MATNTVTGNIVCSDGTNIPLNSELAEGTESDLKTDTVYTVSAQNIGDFAPGKTITHALVSSANGAGYCYVLSQGLVACLIPYAVKGAITDGAPALCQPYTLRAGDKVRYMNSTAAARLAAMSCYTARGVSRIFKVLVTGGATNVLVDLQTSNNIGDTLQGDRIIKVMGTSVDAAKIETQGFFTVDALGNVVGTSAATNPIVQQPSFSSCSIPIALNYKAQFLTNA